MSKGFKIMAIVVVMLAAIKLLVLILSLFFGTQFQVMQWYCKYKAEALNRTDRPCWNINEILKYWQDLKK